MARTSDHSLTPAYEPLDRSAIKLPAVKEEDVLQVSESEVLEVLKTYKQSGSKE